MDWKARAEQLKFEENKTWNEIAETIQNEYFPSDDILKIFNKVRNYIRKTKQYKEINSMETKVNKKTVTYKNGETTFEGIIELLDGEPITPEVIMKAHNLDADKWDVVSYKTNFWQAQAKGSRKMLLYQSKITVKPKAKNQITYSDIEKYFKNKEWEKIKLPEPKQYDAKGETLEVDIADLHSGLLAWREETGKDYDLKIMQNRFMSCIQDIVSRCKGRTFKKIIIANLGDIIHIDNNNQTTTKGTPQQAEGRVEKIVKVTLNIYIAMIKLLSEIAPIEFINVKGNHDELTSYMFALAIQQTFTKDSNITFDISPNPQKARLIGKSLVGFEHGIESKSKQGDWLVNDYRELFGKCKYAEIHSGHLHSQTTEEKGTGVIVKRISALCNSSAWEHINGYRAYKAMICFVWHDEKLLRETWINYV
jgi:hypothetical protein